MCSPDSYRNVPNVVQNKTFVFLCDFCGSKMRVRKTLISKQENHK
jgi:hypothetical protein